jgi:outer membrane protein OmpA-like peptidoglycan-associated protein
MKKICVLLLLIVIFPFQTQAKTDLLFGIKGGVNLASMAFSQEPYSIYKQETFLRPLFSAFVETDLATNISLRPELMFIGRGVRINDLGVEYEFAPNYFDLRVPFLYNFRTTSITPYFLLSPNFGFVIGGQTTRWGVVDDNMNKGYINNFDFGVSLGVGVKFPINTGSFRFYVGVEGQYNLGLINNKPVTNYGIRTNRGIEIALTFSFPISSKSNNSKKVSSRDTVVIRRVDTIKIIDRDTIIVRPPSNIIVDHDKDCYEIREILAYMDNSFAVKNKNICLYDINYDNNKASIDAASRPKLDEIVKLLKKFPEMQMSIRGHADNIGKKEYNDELSQKRAKGVYDYLVSKGINKSRLTYQGYGSSKPIATNDTEEGRYKNRRVEFEITNY